MNWLVQHCPSAQGSKQADGCEQAYQANDVKDEPDEDPDSLCLEVALFVGVGVVMVDVFVVESTAKIAANSKRFEKLVFDQLSCSKIHRN